MWRWRAIIAVSLVSATLGSDSLHAQESSQIAISSHRGPDGNPLIAESGSSLTVPLQIANRSSRPVRAILSVETPDGWSVGIMAGSVEIPPNGSVSRLVLLRIPARAAAGEYRIGFSLEDESGAPLAILSREVHVGQMCDIDIRSEPAERYVEAGSGIVAPVVIRNEANIPVQVRLDARAPKGYEVAMNGDVRNLAVGEVETLSVFISTSSDELETVRRSIVIAAVSPTCNDLRKTTAVSFDVVPARGSERGGAKSIPGRITVVGGATGSRGGAQVQAELAGAINEERDRKIEVEAIFPDRGGLRFGERSSFRMAYETRSLRAEAGDLRVGFTTLTQVPGKGRGLRIRNEFGRFFADGFWARPRLGFPVRSYVGASTGARLNKSTLLAVNFLSQSGVDRRQSVTVAAEYEPNRFGKLGVEFGETMKRAGGGEAVAVNMTGSIDRRLFVSGRLVHAGGGLPGQFSNYDFRQASATYRPLDGLSVQLTGRNEQQSFEPSAGGIWQRRVSKVKGSLGLRERGLAAELFTTHAWRNVTGGSSSSADENDAGVDLRLTRSLFALGLNLRLGQYRDPALDISDSFTRFAISTSIGRNDNSVTMSLERLDGRTLARPLAGSVWAGRLAVRVEPFSQTRLELDAFASRDRFWEDGIYHLIYFRASRSVLNGGSIEGRVQYGSFGAGASSRHIDFGIGLTVPLKVPNPFHSNEKPISGRVYDLESGQPFSSVLVQMGDHVALTDYEGKFELSRPGVGQHLFRVDMSTMSVEYVPMADLPITISVRHREDRTIDVPMARASRAFVRFQRQASASEKAAGQPPLIPVDAAVIEIEDAYGRSRALTNVAGKITFTGIRPGAYTARVIYADLPPNYSSKEEVYTFTVDPGESAGLDMFAVLKKRNIQIVSSGDLTREVPNVGDEPHNRPASDSLAGAPSRTCRPRPTIQRRTQAGETLSTIARDVYGHAQLWPFVWLSNRDRVPDPDRVDIGDELIVEMRTFTVEARARPRRIDVGEAGQTIQDIAAAEIGHQLMWPAIWYSNREAVSLEGVLLPAGDVLVLPGILVEDISTDFCDD
ncbi:MAG: hypothetical protein KJO98_12780 [Rhodothermia bacterium]|nr:hypothetical protein [Rhodothermia bacterium]